MTDKQIKLDGRFISIEEAIKAGLIFEKDIDVLNDRPDWRITLQADHIKRLEEALNAKEQECERLRFPMQDTNYAILAKEEFEEYKKLKQTLIEIIRFFKEDKKFARYSGYPIVFTSSALEEIEKILKENDIKISECEEQDGN